MDPNSSAPLPPQNQMVPPPAMPVAPPASALVSTEPAKYKVFSAIREVFTSITRNPLNTLVPIVLGVVVSAVIAILLAIAFAALGLVSGNDAFPLSFLVQAIVLAVIGYLAQVVVQTGFTNTYMLALRGSYNGEEQPFSVYLKNGFRLFWRAFAATALYVLGVVGPLLAVAVIGLVMALSGLQPSNVSNIILYIGGFVGLIWMFMAILRFSLSVQVAIFEPETSLLKVLRRSSHLMRGGGQWFIVKAVILLLVVSLVVSVVTGNGFSTAGAQEPNIIGSLLLGLLTPFVYGVTTMLYRNRVAVRRSN